MKARLILLLTFAPVAVYGQNDSYDYYLNNSLRNESAAEIVSDVDLFYIPVVHQADIFGSMSEYNFSAARYNRRGLDSRYSRILAGPLDISSSLSGNPHYGISGNFRKSGLVRFRRSGPSLISQGAGGLRDTEEFSTELGLVPAGVGASVFLYDRRGRAGIRVTAAGKWGEKSNYLIWASRRWGRDPHVKGVFTDENSWLISAGRLMGEGHKITLLSTGTASVNGLRSYSVPEAFSLTGDNLYNPSWGYYNGEVRNSKVSRRLQPFTMVHYSGALSGNTRLEAALSYRFGKDRYSALGWFDADNPYPDYYRYMPGYSDNTQVYDELTGMWENGDPNVAQINWNELYQQNSMYTAGTLYFLEDRVENVSDIQFAVGGTTVFDKDLALNYGIKLRTDRSRYYKEAKSLLGGLNFADNDPYLSGDETFGGTVSNDIKHPDRRVGKGDKFGYDYRLLVNKAVIFANLHYIKGRFRASAGLELSESSTSRKGLYEKENFPGRLSSGRSPGIRFTNYSAGLTGGYSFSSRHYFDLSVESSAADPLAGTVFISPYYNNLTISRPRQLKVFAAEGKYTAVFRKVRLEAAGFYVSSRAESAVYRYWDDIETVYSAMTLSGIDKVRYGIELGLEADLTNRLGVKVAASTGKFFYSTDPKVDILADATGAEYVTGAVTRMKDYRLALTPQTVATAEMRYSKRGWLAAVTGSYLGGRYVDPTPLRRMERVYGMADSPEMFSEIVKQEKLGDSFTLDIFLLKSFRTRAGIFTAMLSVNNLLNDKDIVYNAYEQMRLMRTGSGINTRYVPFPSKYLYGYGRTYYLSLSYKY